MTDTSPDKELRGQVVAQCMAVASMANSLALVHNDKAVAFAEGAWPTILEMTGRHTAALMEILGDTLSNMDAVSEEDRRFDPVFKAAHARWPIKGCAHCGEADAPNPAPADQTSIAPGESDGGEGIE